MKAKRIYIVGTGSTVRLVRAAHRAQALAHVARTTHTVRVANQDELVTALTSGVSVENAQDGEQMEIEEAAT